MNGPPRLPDARWSDEGTYRDLSDPLPVPCVRLWHIIIGVGIVVAAVMWWVR